MVIVEYTFLNQKPKFFTKNIAGHDSPLGIFKTKPKNAIFLINYLIYCVEINIGYLYVTSVEKEDERKKTTTDK